MELVLPNHYVVLEQEEMMTLEGAGAMHPFTQFWDGIGPKPDDARWRYEFPPRPRWMW